MELESHAEELASDLGADKQEVLAALENLVEYSVPLDEAKGSVRRRFGGGGGGDGGPTTVDIGEITTESGNVTVTAKVLTVGQRSIRYQGEDQVIREGELADGTGTIDFTAWEEFGIEPGDTVTIGNAGVREWQGRPELNLGQSTTVALADAELEVPYEVGGEADLIDLAPGDRGRTVEVSVLECETKIIDGRDGETEILSGVVGDETARLPFTDWDPREEIDEGATVRLSNVYVREFRGVPSVNVSEFSTVEPIDREIDTSDTAVEMGVGEAVRSGGAYDVVVEGTVVAVRDGSGLIQRCPDCARVIQKGQCRTHGEVEGVDDLRVKAIVDDGTGTLTAVLDDELTERVYGGDLDDALEAARDAMDQSVVAETIRQRVVGFEYRVRGNLSVDEYGANLEAEEFDRIDEDPAARADALLAEVGR